MFGLSISRKTRKTLSVTIVILFTYNSVSFAAPIQQETLRAISTGLKSTVEIEQSLQEQTFSTDKEGLEVFDAAGNKIGQVSRKEVHKKGLLHKMVNVLIFNKQGQLLVTRRSPTKDVDGSKRDVGVSGHITAGNTPLQTALEEINEEIGVKPRVGELTLLRESPFRPDTNYPEAGKRDNVILTVYTLVVDETEESIREKFLKVDQETGKNKIYDEKNNPNGEIQWQEKPYFVPFAAFTKDFLAHRDDFFGLCRHYLATEGTKDLIAQTLQSSINSDPKFFLAEQIALEAVVSMFGYEDVSIYEPFSVKGYRGEKALFIVKIALDPDIGLNDEIKKFLIDRAIEIANSMGGDIISKDEKILTLANITSKMAEHNNLENRALALFDSLISARETFHSPNIQVNVIKEMAKHKAFISKATAQAEFLIDHPAEKEDALRYIASEMAKYDDMADQAIELARSTYSPFFSDDLAYLETLVKIASRLSERRNLKNKAVSLLCEAEEKLQYWSIHHPILDELLLATRISLEMFKHKSLRRKAMVSLDQLSGQARGVIDHTGADGPRIDLNATKTALCTLALGMYKHKELRKKATILFTEAVKTAELIDPNLRGSAKQASFYKTIKEMAKCRDPLDEATKLAESIKETGFRHRINITEFKHLKEDLLPSQQAAKALGITITANYEKLKQQGRITEAPDAKYSSGGMAVDTDRLESLVPENLSHDMPYAVSPLKDILMQSKIAGAA